MLLPLTLVLTPTLVICPWVQPVVRPILLTTSPTTPPLRSSPVIVKDPVISSAARFRLGSAVLAIRRCAPRMPDWYLARAASLRRQRRLAGQVPPVVYPGSVISIATVPALSNGCP